MEKFKLVHWLIIALAFILLSAQYDAVIRHDKADGFESRKSFLIALIPFFPVGFCVFMVFVLISGFIEETYKKIFNKKYNDDGSV